MDTKALISIVLFCVVNGQDQDLDRLEGSSCVWENVAGKCVDARKCTTFEVDLQKRNHPPICSFQGKYPIICCTACFIKDKIDPPPPPLPKLVAKCREYYARLPYACRPTNLRPRSWKELDLAGNCFDSYQTLTAPVGGADAQRDQHPHMVLLGYGSSQESAQWLCAGSIISDRYILSAAHCASQPQLGPVSFVAAGILKRSDPPALWQVYGVKRFIPHPQYQAPSKYDDIALIETDTSIKFSKSVLPACVGEQDLKDRRNVNYSVAHAIGWGGLGHRQRLADTLQLVTLQKFTIGECSRQYPPHRLLRRGFDPTTQICYGDHNEIRDTCQGDSGGPLVREHKGLSCSSHVVGVTSSGADCGVAGRAGVYTWVERYEPWIEGIVFP